MADGFSQRGFVGDTVRGPRDGSDSTVRECYTQDELLNIAVSSIFGRSRIRKAVKDGAIAEPITLEDTIDHAALPPVAQRIIDDDEDLRQIVIDSITEAAGEQLGAVSDNL